MLYQKDFHPIALCQGPHGNYLFFCSHFDERRFFVQNAFPTIWFTKKIMSFQEKRCQRTSEQNLSMKLNIEGTYLKSQNN